MERGNSKGSSTKSTVSDSKNKQDVSSKHLRLPRVKESQSPRPDGRRKPNPQKNRELFDKRPRNKNGPMHERYRSDVTQAFDEPFSKQACKKINLNHLLNFTLAPHEVWEGIGNRPTFNRPRHPKYNKELFLQANCQFVARDNENYAVHQTNPDKLVEWSLIEEVRLPCHEVPSCPICLYVPTAAKITRCGHVYCWPCILHYLSLTDKSWQKCPICFEAVHKTDLRSVSLKLCKSFSVGDEITLCLMKREKGSLISVPVSVENQTQNICTVNDVDAVTRYQKLLLAGCKEVSSILEREHAELNKAYMQEKDTPEVCFIESALTLLKERENTLKQNMEHAKETDNLPLKDNKTPVRKHLVSTSSTESYDGMGDQMNKNTKLGAFPQSPISNSTSSNVNESDKKGFTFFYQAEDSQHIYLHNINVRMLLKEYESLEFAPQVITAKLVEVERVTMTDVLRKRLRYLQHLPLTCEFHLVELDFSHVVSKSIVSQFETEIKKRKHTRSKKARDERKREKMIEQEENKKLGKYPQATYNLSSADQFPVYNPEDFLSLSPPKDGYDEKVWPSASDDYNSNSITESSTHCYADTSAEDTYTPTTSFAQMLKDGPKSFVNPPKQSKPILDTPVRVYHDKDSDDDEEGTPAPEFRQSFSDAIQAALNSITIQDSTGDQSVSKKKKKGKKHQVLFTTSMCRNK